MSSFAGSWIKYVCVWDQKGLDQVGEIDGVGSRQQREGWGQHHADGTVELQHGTGVDGNSHPWVQGRHPK